MFTALEKNWGGSRLCQKEYHIGCMKSDTSLIRESRSSNSYRHLRGKALQEKGQCTAEGAFSVWRRAKRPKWPESGEERNRR